MREDWAGRHVVVLNWRDLDHPQAGGAEVFAESVAAELAAAGATVTLLASEVGGAPAQVQRDGFTVRRAGGTLGVYPAALRWLWTHRHRVDAVLDCQNGIPFFSPLVLPRRTPVVQVVHHVHQRQFGVFFGPVTAAVGRQLEGRGARAVYRRRPVATVSPSTRAEVRQVLRLPGARCLVPNGLDLPAESAAAGLPPRSSAPSIVCVGRLVPHKRVELLLAALPALAAAVPGLGVHIVGDGPDEDRLRALAADADLPPGLLVWHGRLPAAERDQLLGQAWLTVNATHGEGWGLGVMEAAALGVPAVAFRVAGLRDSVRHGRTGWLVEEGTPLAPAVVQALALLGDPAAAGQVRQECLDWAARFTWPRSTDLLAAMLTAEQGQLRRRGRDRRQPDDSTTALTLLTSAPTDAGADDARHHGLRVTDLVHNDEGAARAVLYGSAPAQAALALARRGVRVTGALPADDDILLLAVTAGVMGHGHRPAPTPPAVH